MENASAASAVRGGDRLINEAIKRILQDIVIRGHGDRLIGRWSREPELQQFLEQVPYMLDRINQLHLACTRVESQPTVASAASRHRHHHIHHHHHHHSSERQSSPINDFISLIGQTRHWLVRVRDPLGLTPLHKAVLYNNRPIVEYILDRYADELAAAPISPGGRHLRNQHHISKSHLHQRARLVDAQDKYGRTPLHYAAALAYSNNTGGGGSQSNNEPLHHIYQFLVAKGASLSLRDFRGKTPSYYVRHPNQLRAKSIIHLATKLNANYQAAVLTKTLRAASSRAPISQLSPDHPNSSQFNRESMSVSCIDLRDDENDERGHIVLQATEQTHRPERSRSSDRLSDVPYGLNMNTTTDVNASYDCSTVNDSNKETLDESESLHLDSVESLCSDEFINESRPEFCSPEQALRWLLQERRQGHPVLCQRNKQSIRKCLNDGIINQVFELVTEGYGSFILQEAGNFCWNQQCRRYINKVIPSLLRQLDALHEFIATNQVTAFKTLLSEEPALARIRRPYKRANQSALHIAVQLDRRRIVKHLITSFPELITQRDSNQATCLHLAAKSVKYERLYCWLTEHFGSQLEQLLDNKGKSAAEYRCQALKLSTYIDNHPPIKRDRSSSNVVLLLKQTQDASDKLQLAGSKVPLKSRDRAMKRPNQKATSEKRLKSPQLVVNPTPRQSPEPPLDLSIEISLNEESGESTVSEADELYESKQKQHTHNSHALDEQPKSNLRRQSYAATKDVDSTHELNPASDGERGVDNASAINLLGEMVQLDSNDVALNSKNSPADADVFVNHLPTSIVSEPPNPVSPESVASSSSSSSRRLEPLILSCISSDDFIKLEHLVLAGKGQQVLEVGSNHSGIQSKMRRFLEDRVPELMENILKVHNLLHQCFADEKLSINQKKATNFGRLCSTIERSSELIMGRDSFGATLLHVAIMRSHKRLADYLMQCSSNAASAPDNQRRTAMHYAALALAAYKHHGELKMTSIQDFKGFNLPPPGHWILGEHTEVIYEDLCSRYGELCEVKDKLGVTESDYLRKALDQHHIVLVEEQPSGLLDPQVINNCCPDFAQLLSRYNYFIINDIEPSARVTSVQVTQAGRPEISSRNSSIRSKSGANSTKSMRRTGSCGTTNSVFASRENNRKPGASSSRSRTADELLHQLHTSDIIVPAPVHESSVATIQVAPKPTVGSSVGFHHHHVPLPIGGPEPISPLRAGSSCSGRRTPGAARTSQPVHKGASSSAGGKRRQRPLLDELDPNNPERHHRHHRHHHHHYVLRNGPGYHHSKTRSKSSCPSVVGGVIVPSIIHNDNRDEIETYDIIYRQPPPKTPVPGGMQSSNSDSSSCSSSECDDDADGRRSRTQSTSRKVSNASGKTEALASESASDIDHDDEEEDELTQEDDYDDRVQRLSNEFEERVRKEKSELKAKVDQIMNEIKMSAKSGKSSRFLSSPNEQANQTAEGADSSVSGLVQEASGQISGGKSNAIGEDIEQRKPGNSLSSSLRTSISSTGTSACCSSGSRTCSSVSSSASSVSSKGSARQAAGGAQRGITMQVTEAPALVIEPNDAKATTTTNAKKQPNDFPSLIGDLAAQPASKNTYGQTYLHFIASRSQSTSTLYKVIDYGSHLIGERDIFYRTARDVALQFNLPTNVQIIDKFIIDQFIAGNTRLLRHLLNQGYSPLIHVSDSDGNDIMLILKLLELERMVHFLLQMADFQRWRDELHTFIRHGYSAGVSELISKHKDLIKAHSVHSRTSLHLAVLFDRESIVDELLEVDPSCVHVTDNMGRTALHYTYGLSCLQDAESIRDKLIDKGASLETRDAKMRTPKYYYIFKREIEEIKRIELELN